MPSGLPGNGCRYGQKADRCLYSFLALYLASKSGIYKDGEHTIKVDDSDIKRLYPKYSPELITEAEREWIECGIWDSKKYVKEMAAIHGVK